MCGPAVPPSRCSRCLGSDWGASMRTGVRGIALPIVGGFTVAVCAFKSSVAGQKIEGRSAGIPTPHFKLLAERTRFLLQLDLSEGEKK